MIFSISVPASTSSTQSQPSSPLQTPLALAGTAPIDIKPAENKPIDNKPTVTSATTTTVTGSTTESTTTTTNPTASGAGQSAMSQVKLKSTMECFLSSLSIRYLFSLLERCISDR